MTKTESNDAELGSGRSCFVIGPIGSSLAPAGTDARQIYENGIQMWESVFEPACNRFGLQPLRADKISEPGEITEQIFVLLRDADVVIADVSGGNANVMYELGLRHTRDKITITTGEYERLPFDMNTIRTIQFRRTEAGLIDARNRLIDVLRTALQGGGSPVTATRVWADLPPVDPDVLAAVAARSLENDDDDPADIPRGAIDILADGELAIERMNEIMTKIAEHTRKIGEITEASAEEISKSDSSGAGFAGRIVVARRLAEALKEPSSEMDVLSDDYVSQVNTMHDAVTYIIGSVEKDPETFEELRQYFDSIVEMADSAEEASTGVASFQQGSRNLATIARDLVPVSKTLVRSLTRVLSGNETILGWRDRIKRLPGWTA